MVKNPDFYEITGKLEETMDASEIKDSIFINQWYDFWTPLEVSSPDGRGIVYDSKGKFLFFKE